MRKLKTAIVVACMLVESSHLRLKAQSAMPTFAALNRTFMAQTKSERGTIFSIDVDGREYWITAKHLLTGAKHGPFGTYSEANATLDILNPGLVGQQWLTETFKVIDPGNDIDIVVLIPSTTLISNVNGTLKTGSQGLTLGGECEFLGFPYGGGWRAKFENGDSLWYPYIKRCGISAEFMEQQKVWVLD